MWLYIKFMTLEFKQQLWDRLFTTMSKIALSTLLVFIVSISILVIGTTGAQQEETNRPEQPNTGGVIGVEVAEMGAEQRATFHKVGIRLPQRNLFLVARVVPGGPAQRAGIRTYDFIEIESERVESGQDFHDYVTTKPVGTSLSITVWKVDYTFRNSGAKSIWKKQKISVITKELEKVKLASFRHSYFYFDNEWVEVPEIDLNRDSSALPFVDPPSRTSSRGTAAGHEANYQRLITTLPEVKTGEYGLFPHRLEISQVLGSSDAIVNRTGNNYDQRYWLHGFSMSDVVDGNLINANTLDVIVLGTKSYETVMGSTKTVTVLVSMDKIRRGLSDTDLLALIDELGLE